MHRLGQPLSMEILQCYDRELCDALNLLGNVHALNGIDRDIAEMQCVMQTNTFFSIIHSYHVQLSSN